MQLLLQKQQLIVPKQQLLLQKRTNHACIYHLSSSACSKPRNNFHTFCDTLSCFHVEESTVLLPFARSVRNREIATTQRILSKLEKMAFTDCEYVFLC